MTREQALAPISIGIPFFNAEAYLADAIRSVFAQTHQDWELILVDDGSTDRSLDIARAVNDPRVRVVSDGENKRLPYRLNQITALSQYGFVGRMDADDLISPRRFERQCEVLTLHPEYDLVTTGVCSITNANVPTGVRCGSPEDGITARSLLLGRSPIVHAAILGRTAWFRRNPYDIRLERTEDFELWLRACSRNDLRIHVLCEPLYYYREEENVTTKRLLAAYASQRHLYVRYGALGLNRLAVSLVVAQSHFKSLAVRLLSTAGRLDLLLKRRNTAIEDSLTMAEFLREIQVIRGTRVPGLD